MGARCTRSLPCTSGHRTHRESARHRSGHHRQVVRESASLLRPRPRPKPPRSTPIFRTLARSLIRFVVATHASIADHSACWRVPIHLRSSVHPRGLLSVSSSQPAFQSRINRLAGAFALSLALHQSSATSQPVVPQPFVVSSSRHLSSRSDSTIWRCRRGMPRCPDIHITLRRLMPSCDSSRFRLSEIQRTQRLSLV